MPPTAERWAIVDLFGHTRLAGRVTEVQQFGATMCRIEVPAVDGHPGFTRDAGGASIFAITDITEELAVGFTRAQQPRPVQRYELAMLPPAPATDAEVVKPVCADCETEPCFCDEAVDEDAEDGF